MGIYIYAEKENPEMEYVTDYRGNRFSLLKKYTRIISLVPSITEFLIEMSFPVKNLIGRTRYCIHPAGQVDRIPVIGDVQTVDLSLIKPKEPDLIIVNKEENPQSLVEKLDNTYSTDAVFVTETPSIDEALLHLHKLSRLLKLAAFLPFQDQVLQGLKSIKNHFTGRVLYFVWKKPYMVAGDNTFINSWLEWLGFQNMGAKFQGSYPAVAVSEIKKINPEYLFLASEPYSFSRTDGDELLEILSPIKAKYRIVDGEMFCWYGYRMLPAINYFKGFKIY